MNLVSKEAVSVSRRDAVLALSENTGAHEELGAFAVTLYPFDIQQQADALHQALMMPATQRREMREAPPTSCGPTTLRNGSRFSLLTCQRSRVCGPSFGSVYRRQPARPLARLSTVPPVRFLLPALAAALTLIAGCASQAATIATHPARATPASASAAPAGYACSSSDIFSQPVGAPVRQQVSLGDYHRGVDRNERQRRRRAERAP